MTGLPTTTCRDCAAVITLWPGWAIDSSGRVHHHGAKSSAFVAAHESGHALVAEAVGGTVTRVEIFPDYAGGVARHRYTYSSRAELRIAIAGMVAETVVFTPHMAKVALNHRSSDYLTALEAAKAIRQSAPWGSRGPLSLVEIIRHEVAAVRWYLDRHADQLRHLADVLAVLGAMSGDQVRMALSTVERMPRRAPEWVYDQQFKAKKKSKPRDPLAAAKTTLRERADKRARQREVG